MKSHLKINRQNGFTLFEVLIFTALFTGVAIVCATVLVTVLRVNARQSAAAEVNQQVQFLLTTVERAVEEATSIDNATGGSLLKTHLSDAAREPTLITVSGTTVTLQEGAGAAQALTSTKVDVSALTFTKRVNVNARDVVSVAFTMSYRSSSSPQQYTRTVRTSVQKMNP